MSTITCRLGLILLASIFSSRFSCASRRLLSGILGEVLMSMQFKFTNLFTPSINACFDIRLDPQLAHSYSALIAADCATICFWQTILCPPRLCYSPLGERVVTEKNRLNGGEALEFLQALISEVVVVLIAGDLLIEIFFNFFQSWLINSFVPLNPRVIQSMFKSIS